MDELKLVRAFTFRDYDEILTKGLVLPNDQRWNMYTSNVWPPGLAFDLWTPKKQKQAEWLALQIESMTNDTPYLGHPEGLVYPGVGIITCDASSFDEFKTGLIGIRRTGGEVVWAYINTLEEASQYDEFTVSERFLTPDWLSRLHTQIGLAVRWDRERSLIEALYYDFGSMLRAHEGMIARNR